MAVRRFDEQDFTTKLSRTGGMDALQAEIIGSGLGDLASEIRENHQDVKGAIHQLEEDLRGTIHQLEENLQGAIRQSEENLQGAIRQSEEKVEVLANVVMGSKDSEAHTYMVVDFGNGHLGSCSECLWQRAAPEQERLHEVFLDHHARLLGSA